MAKITIVLPTLNVSGGIRVAIIHAENLARKGHEVFVVCPAPKPPSWKRKVFNLVTFKNNAIASDASKFADRSSMKIHILDEHRPITDTDVPDADFVVATWWETAEWVWDLSAKKGKKIHFVQGHEVFDYLPVDRAEAVLHLPLKKIVVSEWLKDIMEKQYSAENVTLVPNAVDTSEFFAPRRSKNKTPVFGFLYSHVPLKNCIAAIRALEKARERIADLQVVVFGKEQPQKPVLVPDWMEFHISPSKEEIRSIYSRCDAWLFPTISEGFGLPILEAMACRTPVIATRAGAAPQLVDRSVGALLSNDNEDFVEQIIHFANLSEHEWESLSENAFQRAQKNTWSEASKLFEQALLAY